jgi:cellulose synthase/poly-beta-1,6-N-acetylglucosamine synthase-like glycosyltransferase
LQEGAKSVNPGARNRFSFADFGAETASQAAPSDGTRRRTVLTRGVTLVIPAYNAVGYLPRVLPAALAAAKGRRVLVVDPGSSDETAALAKSLGVEVLSLGHRAGPALARNRGVETVTTDVTLFIDSDCVAHPDIVDRVEKAFAADESLVSLTGSYDDRPPERNFASLYMNLRHHFVHQRARTEGASFWAGLGAVRTSVFREIGGFDAEQFPAPMIEDIELSQRLRPKGRTVLDPTLHVTHLKHWTVGGVIRADIFNRAVPWGRLILASGQMPNDLNLAWSQRVAAAIAPLALLGLLGAPALALAGLPVPAAIVALPTVASFVFHLPMMRFFSRAVNPLFALGGWLFHQLHLSYSAATMAVLVIERAIKPASAH